MKPGQLFNLPENITYRLGHIGRIRDKETDPAFPLQGRPKGRGTPKGECIIAKYEVVEVEGKLMGRVLVTYGNRRRK